MLLEGVLKSREAAHNIPSSQNTYHVSSNEAEALRSPVAGHRPEIEAPCRQHLVPSLSSGDSWFSTMYNNGAVGRKDYMKFEKEDTFENAENTWENTEDK